MTDQHGFRTRTAWAALALLIALASDLAAQRPPAEAAAPVPLLEPASSMKLIYGGRPTPGQRVASHVVDPVRAALNDWGPVAERLGLGVAVPESAQALVLGHADADVLAEAAGWIDDTSALFAEARARRAVATAPDGSSAPSGRPPPVLSPPPVLIVVLFDRDGHASDAWPGLLAELVERQALEARFEALVRADKGSLTLRHASIFIQPTYDRAGDASAGDDEFRLGNEIVHKAAQFLVEGAFGRQPEALRWGVGYVAEQRLFGSSYQFDVTGFVATGDHFGWADEVRRWLGEQVRHDDFSMAETVLYVARPGSADMGQKCAWIVLDRMLLEQPEQFAALLTELGALDRTSDPQRRRATWAGSTQQAHDVLQQHLASQSLKSLITWARRFKPRR